MYQTIEEEQIAFDNIVAAIFRKATSTLENLNYYIKIKLEPKRNGVIAIIYDKESKDKIRTLGLGDRNLSKYIDSHDYSLIKISIDKFKENNPLLKDQIVLYCDAPTPPGPNDLIRLG